MKKIVNKIERDYIRQKNRNDKYLLMTTSDPPEILSDWTHNLDHLFYQLKFILCDGKLGSFITNIENSIIKAFQHTTFFRSIGEDRHVYGKLLSRILNTNIILFTDGGKFSTLNSLKNSEKIFSMSTTNDDIFTHLYRWDINFYSFILTGPIYKNKGEIKKIKENEASTLDNNKKYFVNNINNNSLLDINNSNKSINFSNSKDNEKYKFNNTINILKKYSNIIGGECILVETFDDLYIKCDELLVKKLFYNYVNLRFELNPNFSNKILQMQSNLVDIENATNKAYITNNLNNNMMGQPFLKLSEEKNNQKEIYNLKISSEKTIENNFKSANSKIISGDLSKKYLTKINIDFKNFKPIGNNPPDEILLDRNDGILYREKWPLPDDFVISKKTLKLPKKNSNLTYLISSEMLFEIPCKIQEIDEYEISDLELIIKILEFFPNVTIEDLLNQFHLIELNREINIKNDANLNMNTNTSLNVKNAVANVSEKNFPKNLNYLKIYFEVMLNNLDILGNSNNPNHLTNIPNRPFALLKIVLPIKLLKENIKNKYETSEKFVNFLKRILNIDDEKQEQKKEMVDKVESDRIKNEGLKDFKDERDHDMIIDIIMENKTNNNLESRDLIENLNPKNISNNQTNSNNNLQNPISNSNINGIKFKFCVLPYNYKEFFSITNSFEKVINKF